MNDLPSATQGEAKLTHHQQVAHVRVVFFVCRISIH